MTPIAESQAPAPGSRVHPRQLSEGFREKVSRMSPRLAPDSSEFRAAVLLLAGVEVGHNVDRLARLTGYPPDFVARCARRLYDNGVWRGGETCSPWHDQAGGDEAFWADVRVAVGQMCRRVTETGHLEWAPAGYWRKAFEYVGRQPPVAANLWIDPQGGEAPEVGRASDLAAPGPGRAATPIGPETESAPLSQGRAGQTAAARRDRPTRTDESQSNRVPRMPVAGRGWGALDGASLPEPFPDAVWLT